MSSIDEWINVVHLHNGILFKIKNKWNTDAHYNMDEPLKHDAKWMKPVTRPYLFYDYLCDVSRIANL